jgi:hypothetical protein
MEQTDDQFALATASLHWTISHGRRPLSGRRVEEPSPGVARSTAGRQPLADDRSCRGLRVKEGAGEQERE